MDFWLRFPLLLFSILCFKILPCCCFSSTPQLATYCNCTSETCLPHPPANRVMRRFILVARIDATSWFFFKNVFFFLFFSLYCMCPCVCVRERDLEKERNGRKGSEWKLQCARTLVADTQTASLKCLHRRSQLHTFSVSAAPNCPEFGRDVRRLAWMALALFFFFLFFFGESCSLESESDSPNQCMAHCPKFLHSPAFQRRLQPIEVRNDGMSVCTRSCWLIFFNCSFISHTDC